MLVTDSQTINQFDSNFDNLKIVFLLLLIIFSKIKFTTFDRLTRFQSSSQLQLEFYYHFKKLNMHHLTMEEKIITAIQNIRSKSKQRVTSQRIFRFINKVALSIECELFQDCMSKLEIDGRIYKKRRGKNASFLLSLFPRTTRKMMGRIA